MTIGWEGTTKEEVKKGIKRKLTEFQSPWKGEGHCDRVELERQQPLRGRKGPCLPLGWRGCGYSSKEELNKVEAWAFQASRKKG